MNIHIKYFFISVLALIVIYATFAFGCWDLNAGHWEYKEVNARSLCAMLMFIVFVVINIIPFTQEKPKK